MRIKSVNLNVEKLHTETQVNKARICADRLLEIMRSDRFKEEILGMEQNYWLRGESLGSTFRDKTNEEIYTFLMEGKEEWNTEKDYEIDLLIAGYWGRRWSGVVGYMIPGNPQIFVNYKFFNSMKKNKVVSNMCHEWTHTMGARHNNGAYLRMSFPYFINTVVEKIYKEMFEPNAPEPVEYEWICVRKWYRFFAKKCYQVRK